MLRRRIDAGRQVVLFSVVISWLSTIGCCSTRDDHAVRKDLPDPAVREEYSKKAGLLGEDPFDEYWGAWSIQVMLGREDRDLLRTVDLSLSNVTLEQAIKALEKALHSPIPHRLEGCGFRRIKELRVQQKQALQVLFLLAGASGSMLDGREGRFVFIAAPAQTPER
jgi:hypothetical protein